jgi:hypothetical protein
MLRTSSTSDLETKSMPTRVDEVQKTSLVPSPLNMEPFLFDVWMHDLTTWIAILARPTVNVFAITSKPKRKKVAVKHQQSYVRKQRRRDTDEKLPFLGKQAIVGPELCLALDCTSPSYYQQAAINKFSQMLPIDVHLHLFGFAHKMILLAALYKHNNLTWLLLNRVNNKIYLASHFAADALHLFKQKREAVGLKSCKKFHRQGINEIISLATSADHRHNKKTTKLNFLSRSVLKFAPTSRCLDEIKDFLRGVGPSGQFATTFARMQSLPTGFQHITQTLAENARRSKVFKKQTMQDECKPNCACADIVVEPKLTSEDTIAELISQVPSSLEAGTDRALHEHFQPFVKHVREHPNLFYFPQTDMIL